MKRMCTVLTGLAALVMGMTGASADVGERVGFATLRSLAEADLARLEGDSNDRIRVVWPTLRATPSRVSGLRWTRNDASPEDIGAAFLAEFPGLTGADPATLELAETEGTRSRTVLHFQQRWQGIKVLGGQVILSLDDSGRVLSMASSTARLDGLDMARDIGRKAAARAAIDRVHGDGQARDLEPLATLVILPGPGRAVLVWRVVVPTVPMVQKIVCLVDATTGEILKVTDEVIR